MRPSYVVLGSMLLAACGDSDCERMYDKMMSIKPKDKPAKMDKSTFVKECSAKMANASDEDKKVFKCMLDAPDAEAMEICATGGKKLEYLKKSKATEAELNLNKIGKSAKIYFHEKSQFPVGTSATLPNAPCCGSSGAKCAVTTEWQTDKIWQALDFQVDDPNLFQYSYESTDGKTATVKAVGDLDCDAMPITYTLKLDAPGGNPSTTIEKPANSD